MTDPKHHGPPNELTDYYYFQLFNRTKSLEEIDAMDVGRLSAALEAGGYAKAWENDRKPGAATGDKKKAMEMMQLARQTKRGKSR